MKLILFVLTCLVTFTVAVFGQQTMGGSARVSGNISVGRRSVLLPPITTNLVMFADGSTSATMTFSGTRVDEWRDRMGSGRKFVTGSNGTSFNPAYSSTGFSGRGSVVFTGNKYLETSVALTECTGDNYTILLVLKRLDDNTTNFMVTDRTGSAISYGLLANSYGNRIGTTTGRQAPTGFPNDTPAIVGVSANGMTNRFLVNDTVNDLSNGSPINYASPFGIIQLNGLNGAYFTNIEVAAALIYNTALNDSQMLQIQDWAKTSYGALAPVSAYNIVVDGNSIAAGMDGRSKNLINNALRALGLTESDWLQFGIVGASTSALAATAATRVDTQLNLNFAANRRILVFYEVTNDLSNANQTDVGAYNNIVAYCNARRAAGWKVVIATCLPRTGAANPNFETYRLSVNTMIRNNYLTFADGLADIGGDATVGTAAAASNATYYGDGVHPTDAAVTIMYPYFQTAINSILNP